jgi:antitoxin (DNA-binding transcriptional repressor) of toxin-antitoxin stability system
MKTATVRDLRNEFGRLSKWLERGETVQIVKRGKPFARVVPEPTAKTFVGACRSSVPLPDDLDDPVNVEWEAQR